MDSAGRFAAALISVLGGAGILAGTVRAVEPAATSQEAADAEVGGATHEAAARPLSLNYFVQSRAYGAQPESEPPRYVRTLSETGIAGLESLHWLDLGVDHRTRFEYHDDDFRQPELARDTPFLIRSRLYLGIHDIVDPFRMGFEFQDARIENTHFDETDRDVDENDILQLFGELFFKDALGPERPLRFLFGRQAFEYLDRRLISRNPWRNTANNFDGFRMIFGQEKNDWQVDVLALHPVERRVRQPDRSNEEEWFYGLIGNWRRWSKIITLQPYYLVRDQDRKALDVVDREIHTLGLRGYGMVGKTGLDYDVDVAFQVGDDGPREQRALAFAAELGYLFDHAWKPRVSAMCGYAGGDRAEGDNFTERFDRNFGFARPWSAIDYIIWENVITPKVRFEAQPYKTVRFDTGFGGYWLASDSDSWRNANRIDRTGTSGDCIGHEFDARIRWQVDPRIELTFGYSHFTPGAFTDNTGPSDDSDFFYIETDLQLFK